MGLVLISTATISSSVASVTIEANIDATYDLYEFHFENIHFSADDYSKIVCYFRTAADDGYDQLVTSANHYIGSYEKLKQQQLLQVLGSRRLQVVVPLWMQGKYIYTEWCDGNIRRVEDKSKSG